MFKKEEENCEVCGKSFDDLKNGRDFCQSCNDEAELEIAGYSAFGHFTSAIGCFFNFEFLGFFLELIWSFQRLFKVGAYGPQGDFTLLLKKHERKMKAKVEEAEKFKGRLTEKLDERFTEIKRRK